MDDIEEQLKKMMGNLENMPNIIGELSNSSASKDDVLRELKMTNQHLATLLQKIDTVLYYLQRAYGGPIVDTVNDKKGL
jgi:DNA repair ATPase RecN